MSLHYQMASGFREKIDKEICDPQYFHRVEWQTSSTGLYRGNPYTVRTLCTLKIRFLLTHYPIVVFKIGVFKDRNKHVNVGFSQ